MEDNGGCKRHAAPPLPGVAPPPHRPLPQFLHAMPGPGTGNMPAHLGPQEADWPRRPVGSATLNTHSSLMQKNTVLRLEAAATLCH